MAKNSIEAYGAKGKTNTLFFDPDDLTLVTDENSPLYDPRVHLPVDENMVLNIMFQGVIQAISVCKNPETGKTEVAAGRQRVKAAREANKRLRERGQKTLLVPANVRRGSGAALAAVMVSENEIRQSDTPIGRAEKMQRLMAQGYGEADLAVVFGCTMQTVKATLMLLECCADVQKAVEAGTISITHAKQLAKLEPAEQREKVAELIAAGDGAKPRERAQKQRAVLGTDKPKMRTRAEIAGKLSEVEDGPFADALKWVLGNSEEQT